MLKAIPRIEGKKFTGRQKIAGNNNFFYLGGFCFLNFLKRCLVT
jgi:hypothetical protein